MPLSLTPLNTVQKIPTEPINDRIVLQPHTWYTCPAGKKAIIKGHAVCTGTGAAANTTHRIAGVTVRRCLAAGGGSNSWDRDIAPNVGYDFEGQMAAGEIMDTIQDSGTNAEWDILSEVQETPI